MGLNKRCSICGGRLEDDESSFLDLFFEEGEVEYAHDDCLYRDEANNLLSDIELIREAYDISDYEILFCSICHGVLTSYDSIDELYSTATETLFAHFDCVESENSRESLFEERCSVEDNNNKTSINPISTKNGKTSID